MKILMEGAQALVANPKGGDWGNLLALSHVFAWFGRVHPFLDGNGHIQRAVFAAMATEFGYPLSSRFAIHPRPYGALLAIGLEIFSKAPEERAAEELPLVAEYLAFFIEGPFETPRSHVPPEPLY